MTQNMPLWSTPERQQHLLTLFHRHGNQCLKGHAVCPEPSHYIAHEVKMEWEAVELWKPCFDEYGQKTGGKVQVWGKKRTAVYEPIQQRLYNRIAEAAIESWKDEDRERCSYEWKLEQRHIQDGTYGKFGSTFDPVDRDVYVNSRPAYFLVGMGVSPINAKRVVLIRIASTGIHLFVDVGPAVQEIGKNARRKAMRYGKFRNGQLMEKINEMCVAAVSDWWGHRSVTT